ncbi:MAG: NAD(P)/FAD-dependent oxidoreductase [Variovorax sp.]|jgi:thioredoxin reductase (NADPH)|nr:NAD(P)/FAD-dependent oxidoreductase [Variovorax sp.]
MNPSSVRGRPTADGVADVLIVGGGAAGLTAAIYLARFRRSVVLLDAMHSRVAKIPRTHNYPGFAEGIAGNSLLDALRRQLGAYDACRVEATVEHAWHDAEGFGLQWPTGSARGKLLLLATGVDDIPPAMPHVLAALQAGALRYCPVCDAYEVIGRKVGVYGTGSAGVAEAIYLRHFTPHLTLFVQEGAAGLAGADRQRLAEAGIRCFNDPVRSIAAGAGGVTVAHGDSETTCESLYCALGVRVHAGLGRLLGAQCDETGYLVVDEHHQTSVEGLYAAGDVAQGLNQIVVATGAAAIAASAMHRRLEPLR